ncbi:MAG: division/cell wall cluster transcriptional repressor MraZ [Candidatus Omnitrophica bacterium]|nr:division/cell wall cluster transcriptional repressor MraZ [Candidatus Omnitrophota bacterium]
MFYGEYEHSIDPKGRLIIPAKFRQALKTHDIKALFLTRGLDGCLFVFSESEWRLAENRFKQIPFTKAEGRKFNRLFFSGATELAVDGLGRLLIPKTLKDFAQIKQDVVIVGVSTRMEIWAKEKWQQFYESSRQSFEEVAERVMLE